MPIDLPARLYKYFPPNRAGLLQSLQVRFTPLGAFNDPFEGWPRITEEERPVTQALDWLNEPFDQAKMAAVVQAFPKELRGLMSWNEVKNIANAVDPAAPIPSAKPETARELAFEILTRRADELLGVFCVSEVPDSLLMWSHYADSHAGFVIEFDGTHPYFRQQRTPDDDFNHLRRVQYTDTRPGAQFAALSARELFLVKSSHWLYEREWRITRYLKDATQRIDAEPLPVHLFELPPDLVTGVIIGVRASTGTEGAVRSAIAGNPRLTHVRMRRAQLDPKHFQLDIDPRDWSQLTS